MFLNKKVELKIVLENTCLMDNVLAQHGVSFWLNYYGKKYLFDCGQIFVGLKYNLKQMKLKGKDLEAVIISHDHHDHCNALKEFVEKFEPKKIYVPSDFSSFKSKEIQKVDNYLEIEKGLFLTGSLNGGNIKEQSLVIDFGDKGIMIITGCSHPGLINIIEKSQKITGNNKIMGIIGGFHLVESKEEEIQEIINYLKTLDLGFLIPGHCTGIDAIQMMREQLKDKLKISHMGSIGVGNSIVFTPKLKIKIDEW